MVRRLTGVDTDRLKEEKARGISIDLGFAYRSFVEGCVTGFVDVPGHERFVHTMAAGAAGIDYALLVVAVDDGVMPQTREHLAILDLLGIRRGVVALSKADLADANRRVAATGNIRNALAATALRDVPILPVSVVTGEGIGILEAELATAERQTAARDSTDAFRLSVDRSFTMAGAGTIVTGTVLSGGVAVADHVTVSPSGLHARVRSIHAQNRPTERAAVGQRCALNLAGDRISKDAIGRGDFIVEHSLHAPTARIDVALRMLAGGPSPVGHWFPAHLHHASVKVGVRVVPLGSAIEPGATGLAQLVLQQPVAAAIGDRFVLRDVSAQRTIGGGRFLDLRAPARKRRTPERLAVLAALAQSDAAGALRTLLSTAPFAVDLTLFARDRALSADTADQLFGDNDDLAKIEAGAHRFVLTRVRWAQLSRSVEAELSRFHGENADLTGVGREQLRLRVNRNLPPDAFTALLQQNARAGSIILDGAFVRLPGHRVRLSEGDEALWCVIAPRLGGEQRFRPPRIRDLALSMGLPEPEVRRILQLCSRVRRVDEIAHDHFFGRSTTAEMILLTRELAERSPEGIITVAALRDTLGNGRKVAIQILEFFDRHGITTRQGDLRWINPRRLDLFLDEDAIALNGTAQGLPR